MNDSDKLDKYITILKKQFPDFIYINTLTDECQEFVLPASACDYTIIVKNIPRDKFVEFSSYLDKNILYDLIEKDEPLPCVIQIQKEEGI
jgi:wyosine [tRNA(Phe)-imidazoG37] synthetase (radical SAM superfamily)